MANTVTQLTTAFTGGPNPPKWVLNIDADTCSSAFTIKDAVSGKRHWIEKVNVTGKFAGTEWYQILDGNNTIIGNAILATGVPWQHQYQVAICGTAGNTISIKTKSDIAFHCIVEGFTDP